MLGGPRKGHMTYPRCGTKIVGSWVAQWDLPFANSKKEKGIQTSFFLWQQMQQCGGNKKVHLFGMHLLVA